MPVREPFFSVVTPTFNRGQFLGKAIESVQAQTISDYEHIIVDDGSVDNTEELVKEYSLADSRIIYIKQKNRGRSIARNIGMKRAQGDYVCFLDS
ncbi:MAG: glycosyltransferase involved in cell wall biosynthesis, partial [Psychroserpens sp.]